MSSPKAQTRYTSRSKPIKFLDDNNISSAEWPTAFLHLEYNRTGLFVMSDIFLFNPNTSTAQTDCTLLSPFRAMEWIYIDSLKRQGPCMHSCNNSWFMPQEIIKIIIVNKCYFVLRRNYVLRLEMNMVNLKIIPGTRCAH